jgi:hypothetical protein
MPIADDRFSWLDRGEGGRPLGRKGGAMLWAVIFDVDGTLIDSVDAHARAWRDMFARYSHEIPFDEIRHY